MWSAVEVVGKAAGEAPGYEACESWHPFRNGPFIVHPTGIYGGSSRDAIAAFKHVLDRARIPATVRLTRGRDIAAACGQLAATR